MTVGRSRLSKRPAEKEADVQVTSVIFDAASDVSGTDSQTVLQAVPTVSF